MADIKEEKSYRPYLSKNKDYLRKVAGSISERGPMEEINFQLLNEALQSLGVSENPYSLVDADNFQGDAVEAIANRAFEAIERGISDETKEKLRFLWDYLGESDPLEKSDLIFVFGGGGQTRPKEAAKLYKEGWAPKILFTGHKGSFMNGVEKTEAEAFSEVATQEGVLREDIILEKEAVNTIENAQKSVALLKSLGDLPKKVILVQLTYQMRRAYLTFKAAIPIDWSPELIKHSAPSGKFKREDYFMDKDGWGYVFNEFIKMYGARLMKHF